jgi:hypothetical protein
MFEYIDLQSTQERCQTCAILERTITLQLPMKIQKSPRHARTCMLYMLVPIHVCMARSRLRAMPRARAVTTVNRFRFWPASTGYETLTR